MGIADINLYIKNNCIEKAELIERELPTETPDEKPVIQRFVRLELKNFSIYTGELLPNTVFEFDLGKFEEAVGTKKIQLLELTNEIKDLEKFKADIEGFIEAFKPSKKEEL